MWRIWSRSAWVASGGTICETGSPTKLKSEKAMNATTSITATPWSSRRRMKAINLSHLHPLQREPVVRAVHHAHVRAHRPRDHLEVQRNVADVLHVRDERLAREGRALDRIDLGLQLVHRRVDLRVRVAPAVVVAVR